MPIRCGCTWVFLAAVSQLLSGCGQGKIGPGSDRSGDGDADSDSDVDADTDADADADSDGTPGWECSDPADPAVVETARQWLSASPSDRAALEASLSDFDGCIDSVIEELRPHSWNRTETGEIWDQTFTVPEFAEKYPNQGYHLFVPHHYTPDQAFGLIFWLIGGGSPEPNEMEGTRDVLVSNPDGGGRDPSYLRPQTDESNFIAVAPVPPQEDMLPVEGHASRWNFPGVDRYLMDMISEISLHYHVDTNRVVMTGHSMGGIGSYHQSQRMVDRLAATSLNSGHWMIADWRLAKYSPVYIIHGTNDETNTIFEYADLADRILTQLGIDHVFWPYEGPHAWTEVAEEGWTAFVNGQSGWVQDKIRDPYRPDVLAITPRTTYEEDGNFGVNWQEDPSPDTFWVSLNETRPGTIPFDDAEQGFEVATREIEGASAEVVITSSTTITATTRNVAELGLWLHPRMVDVTGPLTVTVDGAAYEVECHPNLVDALRSYERRWDWNMIYPCEVRIDLP